MFQNKIHVAGAKEILALFLNIATDIYNLPKYRVCIMYEY
jgi:hypothetical protein